MTEEISDLDRRCAALPGFPNPEIRYVRLTVSWTTEYLLSLLFPRTVQFSSGPDPEASPAQKTAGLLQGRGLQLHRLQYHVLLSLPIDWSG
jgi:hypothetical protein